MATAADTPLHKVRSRAPSNKRIQSVLRDTFGLKKLRDAQSEVISSVFSGQHTLAIMPTGSGKSLCYQLPGQILPGTTIIVSPLIALMKDQKEKMDDLDIESVQLNSSIASGEQADSMKSLRKGKTDFLYATPERLANPEFQKALKKIKIDLFVIDEAHCMSQWGHDFRPDYLSLPEVWKSLGKPQLLALTATATEGVIAEIKDKFELPDLTVIQSGVFRKNLVYECVHIEKETEKLENLNSLLATLIGPGIIYSATVKGVEETHKALAESGHKVVKYHGRMKAKERTEAQDLFMSGEVPLIVATNAFGMGIDKRDIRFVIHYHFTGSLEAYYQESGRAGRDGKESRCILFYLKKDKSTQSFFLVGKYPKPEDVYAVYQVLDAKGSSTLKEIQETLPSVAKSKVKAVITALIDAEIASAKGKGILVSCQRELEQKNLEVIYKSYTEKKEHDKEKLRQMIIYSQSALCRWKFIANYFSQPLDWETCGHCDNCLRRDFTAAELNYA